MRRFQNGIQPRKNISVEIPEQRGPVQTAFIWNFLSTLPVLQKPHFLVNGAMFPRRCLSPLDLGVPCLNTMAQGFGFGLLIPGSWDGSFFFLARAVAYSVCTARRSVFSRNKLLWFSSLSFSLVRHISSFVSRPGLTASDCAVRESACSKSQTRVLLCFAVYSSKVQPLIRLCLVPKLGLLS